MKITLPNVRLAFPVIWTPEPYPEGNDPTPYFSANFLIPKDAAATLKRVQDAIDAVAQAKWPTKWAAILKAAGPLGKICLRDGDLKENYDGYEGCMFVSARSKVRPGIFDGLRNPLTEADGKPYSGCYVNAVITLFAYDNAAKGVSANLSGVQFLRDGDAFSGGRPAQADDFDDVTDTGEGDAESDPLAN